MNGFKAIFGSKKALAFFATVLLSLLKGQLGLDEATIGDITNSLMVYVGGQSAVDVALALKGGGTKAPTPAKG